MQSAAVRTGIAGTVDDTVVNASAGRVKKVVQLKLSGTHVLHPAQE
jgi:hypothetical protein